MAIKADRIPANPIRKTRELRGLRASDLSALLGVSRNTLWRWETNKMAPSGCHLMSLARVLQQPPEDLIPNTEVDTFPTEGEPKQATSRDTVSGQGEPEDEHV